MLTLAILVIVTPVVGYVVQGERSARRAHEAAERRYRDLFEGSGVPAVVLDEAGRIQEANPAAGSLLDGTLEGQALADVLGKRLPGFTWRRALSSGRSCPAPKTAKSTA